MAHTIGIKRTYEDAFLQNDCDSYGVTENYSYDGEVKRARVEAKNEFFINVRANDNIFLANFRLLERLKYFEEFESLIRENNDELVITDFAFHNPTSSEQAIKVLNASEAIISHFSVNYACFPTSSSGKDITKTIQPYDQITNHLWNQKCCAIVPYHNFLFILYVGDDDKQSLRAVLIEKFYYVLDLDDTLVRSRLPKLESETPEEDESLIYVGQHRVFTKILCNVPSFLEWANKLFHIVFVTNSVFPYASTIVRMLDQDRKHVLRNVRTLDYEGLSTVLKHRGDLLCFVSNMNSINNDIGLDEEEKRRQINVKNNNNNNNVGSTAATTVKIDINDDDEEDKNDNREHDDNDSPDNNNNKKRRRFSVKENLEKIGQLQLQNQKNNNNGEKKKRDPSRCLIPSPPSPEPENKKINSNNNNNNNKIEEEEEEIEENKNNKKDGFVKVPYTPKFVFVKDLENLGLDPNRSVVFDDQKHVWIRNQFNCVPFSEVNNGQGLEIQRLKTESFKKMMELQMRVVMTSYNQYMQAGFTITPQ